MSYVLNVNAAPLAGLEARLVDSVNVVLLLPASKDTPVIVYVPVIPATVNVSPATGVVCVLATVSVVPVWLAPSTTASPYGGILLASNLLNPSILLYPPTIDGSKFFKVIADPGILIPCCNGLIFVTSPPLNSTGNVCRLVGMDYNTLLGSILVFIAPDAIAVERT